MNEMEEDIIREHMYEDHRQRMNSVKKNLKITRIYNFYFNIFVTFVSIFGIFLWFTNTNSGIKFALIMDEELGEITFPWYAVTFFLTPPVALMSYLSDVFLKKKLNIACEIIYLVILLFSVSNMFIGFESMAMMGMLLLIVYSGLGLWTQDMTVRSFKEIEYLKTQEGYPDFNYGIDRGRHSRYVKDREAWLNKKKKQEYYSENEKPVTDFAVEAADKDVGMDGISVDIQTCSDWYEEKKALPSEAETADSDMEYLGADPALLPDSSEYEIDDIRRKPL